VIKLKVLTIANTKGGAGKSTVAAHLSVCFSQDNKSVLLVDADKQQSLMKFRQERENNGKDDLQAVSIIQKSLYKDIEKFSNFDVIIIDVGGHDDDIFRSAIYASKLGIVVFVSNKQIKSINNTPKNSL
jgi:chromosome partitioning protein